MAEAGLCAHSRWQLGAKFIAELIVRDVDLFHWSQMVIMLIVYKCDKETA